MNNINSESLCKFEYEYLGKSLKDLAHRYQFPLAILEDAATTWERKIEEPVILPKAEDLVTFADQLEQLTKARLSVISLYRQIENQPLYAQLETGILNKAIALLETIQPDNPRSAHTLGLLTKILTTIQERNPIQLAEQLENKRIPAGITVNVANMIQ